MAKPKYYKANQGFATELDGEPLFVQKGELVSADHKLLKGREQLFDVAETFGRFDTSEVEQATAAPGEKRGKPARKKRTARSTSASASVAQESAATSTSELTSSFGLKTSDIGEKQP